MKSQEKIVLALSGGIDSATILGFLISQKKQIFAVQFLYGAKHNFYELKCFSKLCEFYGVKNISVNLTEAMSCLKSNLFLTGGKIPEGLHTSNSMKSTIVPARNLIFTSFLAGIAETNNASKIALGIHQGDHAIYPDCRLSFFDAMNEAIQEGTDNRVSFIAPFLNMTKNEIIKKGTELNVPYYLTRTCYKEQEKACGKCGACVERLEAFKINNIQDPITYEGD